MEKLLVVVDMQNDFIDGCLGTKEAQAIVKPMAEYIKNFNGNIFYTLDTHKDNYMETQEGKNLPVPHCIKGTVGWLLAEDLTNVLLNRGQAFEKNTFGSVDLGKTIRREYEYTDLKEIYFCGLCTDICVISNALLVKAFMPEIKINVIENLCAGVTPETHKNAIEAMKMCQINIIEV